MILARKICIVEIGAERAARLAENQMNKTCFEDFKLFLLKATITHLLTCKLDAFFFSKI